MAGVFEKIRLAGLAHIHALLDKDIDWNNVQVVKQTVRDLEASLDELEDGAAESAGYLRTVTREKGDIERRVKVLDAAIDLILGDDDLTNDHLATAKQVELDGVTARLADVALDLEDAKATSRKMEQAVSMLRSKHVSAQQKVQKLESMETSRKAKEHAVKAVKMVAEMTQAGAAVSVDSVIDRMRRQNDVTDEKFDRAFDRASAASGQDMAVVEANAKIEERKRRMALSKAS